MNPIRLYLDTSVFGGCFDEEFFVASEQLFDEIRSGRFALIVSETLLLELVNAPSDVRRLLESLPDERVESVFASNEIDALRDAYLDAGVVGRASLRDAEHVAAATIARVDLVVSWNFKHIVHFDKIAGYNGVNLLRGYDQIRIHSPREVVEP